MLGKEDENLVEGKEMTLRDYLKCLGKDLDLKLSEEGVLNIDEINRKREERGEGFKELSGILLVKNDEVRKKMLNGELAIKSKNILFPKGFEQIKKIFYILFPISGSLFLFILLFFKLYVSFIYFLTNNLFLH